ncbi:MULTISPECIES: hypothetical protein [Aurantimonas]|uniref:hypothetical protein n=1 Tax=Aurantimonas TaxID=182269 RepID=UPI003516A620
MPISKTLTISDIIRADKQNVTIGEWETGPIPKAKFPLTRSKLSLGRGWNWRVVTFNALTQRFVVLVALSEEREYYRATLAMRDGKTLKVICFHELHADHWNWHCHLIRGNVHNTFPGVLRDKNLMSAWPVFTKRECTVPFNVTQKSALTIAAARFRFAEDGGFL